MVYARGVSSGPTPRPAGKYAKRAVVIVHGIGVQERGSTRLSLVRALQAHAGAKKETLVDPDCPLELGKPVPQQPLQIAADGLKIDVYEIYWAPLTSHKTTARSVLNWMLTTTFVPAPKIKKPSPKTSVDLLQSLVYSIALLLLGLEIAMMMGNTTTVAAAHVADGLRGPAQWSWLTQVGSVLAAIRDSFRVTGVSLAALSPAHIAEVLTSMQFLVWVGLAVLVWLTAQLLYRIPQLRLGSPGPQLVICLILALTIFVLIQTVASVLAAFALIVAAGGWIARSVAYFLSESLGDVQVYANRNENGAHYAAREAVIAEAEHVFELVKRRKYTEVIVFAHSLGAVVAFDVLDGLRIKDPDLLKKVRVFVTFGSALEKVRYFFDRKAAVALPTDPNDAVRTRLTKTAQPDSSRKDAVREAFNGVADDRAWINIWYWNDVVADPISSFDEPPSRRQIRSLVSSPGVLDAALDKVTDLLAEAKRESCVNLSGWTGTPWPLSHSHYLKSSRVERLFARIAFHPDLP